MECSYLPLDLVTYSKTIQKAKDEEEARFEDLYKDIKRRLRDQTALFQVAQEELKEIRTREASSKVRFMYISPVIASPSPLEGTKQ
jgi:hypothetical protein